MCGIARHLLKSFDLFINLLVFIKAYIVNADIIVKKINTAIFVEK